MVEKTEKKVPPFHQRFNISVPQGDVQKRFINRAISFIHGVIPELEVLREERHKQNFVRLGLINVAAKLGVSYKWNTLFSGYAGTDYYSCLLALEALYQTYYNEHGFREYAHMVNNVIKSAISLSENDMGIEWRDGAFWPSGAKLLDETLINENLKWLEDKGYKDVLIPFEKGLRHFLEATQKPERLGDTVTDVYEAVEALARIVTGNNKELSGNAELFINKLKLSDYYKKMLKDYIDFACDYRHAVKLGEKRKPLLRNEVEAFIYTSGLFIRLAIQQMTIAE